MSNSFLDHLKNLFHSVDAYACFGSYTGKQFRQTFFSTKEWAFDLKPLVDESVLGKKNSNVSIALFDEKKRGNAEAKYLYDVFLDFDNYAFKTWSNETNPSRLDDAELIQEKLTTTRAELLNNVLNLIYQYDLGDYATIISTGSGFHFHFFLKEIVSINDDVRLQFEILMKRFGWLFREVGLDPQAGSIANMCKWILGTKTHKAYYVEEVEVYGESVEYISFDELCQKVESIVRDLNGGEDIHEEEEEAPAELKEWSEKWLDNFHGILLQNEYSCDDGGKVSIDPDLGMSFVERRRMKVGKQYEMVEIDTEIQSGYALFPAYYYELDEEIVFMAVVHNGDDTRFIELTSKELSDNQKLQLALYNQMVDLTIGRNVRTTLFSYLKSNSTRIEVLNVGVDSGSLISHDFIFRDGQVYPIADGLVEIEGRHCEREHIKVNLDLKSEMCRDENFRDGIDPSKTPEERKELLNRFCALLDRSYQFKIYNRLILGYIGASMIRGELLSIFQDFPLLELYGEKATGKSSLCEFISQIANVNIINNSTPYNVYRKQNNMKNGFVVLDDLMRLTDKRDNWIEFLKGSTQNHTRERNYGGKIVQMNLRNSIVFNTNYPVTDDALVSRVVKAHFENRHTGSREDFFELKKFVSKHKAELYLAVFEQIGKISIPSIVELINAQAEELSKSFENSRIAEVYAIVLVAAECMGFEIDGEELKRLIEKETRYNTKKSAIAGEIAEHIVYLELKQFRGSNPTDWEKEEADHQIVVKSTYRFSFTGFWKHMVINGADKFMKKSDLTEQLEVFSFCSKKRGNRGIVLEVDLTDEIFGEFIDIIDGGKKAWVFPDEELKKTGCSPESHAEIMGGKYES